MSTLRLQRENSLLLQGEATSSGHYVRSYSSVSTRSVSRQSSPSNGYEKKYHSHMSVNLGNHRSYHNSFDSDIDQSYHSSNGYERSFHQSDVLDCGGDVRHSVSLAGAVSLKWKDLTVSSSAKKKGLPFMKKTECPAVTILDRVSGIAKPGDLIAIMGASGSGKTTLLNTLTGRASAGLEVTGDVLLNGESLGADIGFFSGYIQQEDIFMGALTVREHLVFYSRLRMNPDISDEDRNLAIEDVMKELGLQRSENTVIGEPGVTKGLSGGEKKRLAFATELLTSPQILFADEPTSGLDSFMAQSVVESMQNLANKGRAVLTTIHQPSSAVYALFKQLILMAEGKVVYAGPTSQLKDFFAGAGFPFPAICNPADFFVMELAIVPGEEKECRKKIRTIQEAYEKSDQKKQLEYDLEHDYKPRLSGTVRYNEIPELRDDSYLRAMSRDMTLTQKRQESRYLVQMYWLFWRSFKILARDVKILRARTFTYLFAGVFLGVVYLRQKYNQTGVANISGALFIIIAQATFTTCFGAATVFTSEFAVLRKDYRDKTHAVFPYFIAKTTTDVPSYVIFMAIFSTITYWMIGLNPYFSNFIIYFVILLLHTLVAAALGHFASSLSEQRAVAFAVLPFLIGVCMFFSGFIVREGTESPLMYILIFVKYISPFRWSYMAAVVNQWFSIEFIECQFTGVANGTVDVAACVNSGREVVWNFGYDQGDLLPAILAMVGILIGFELISLLLLTRKARAAV